MAEKARVIFTTTPGVVSDELLRAHGIGKPEIAHARYLYGLRIERAYKLGYYLLKDE